MPCRVVIGAVAALAAAGAMTMTAQNPALRRDGRAHRGIGPSVQRRARPAARSHRDHARPRARRPETPGAGRRGRRDPADTVLPRISSSGCRRPTSTSGCPHPRRPRRPISRPPSHVGSIGAADVSFISIGPTAPAASMGFPHRIPLPTTSCTSMRSTSTTPRSAGTWIA